MGRTTSITPDEVNEAILDLLHSGSYPNPSNVREKLGRRGSTPVLQRMIGDWYANHGPTWSGSPTPAKVDTETLQGELRRLMEAATGNLTERQRVEDARLTELAATLEGRAADLLSREEALLAAEARLNQRDNDQAPFIAALTSERNEATQRATDLATALSATAALRDRAVEELAQSIRRQEQLDQELRQMQPVMGELAAARERSTSSQEQARELQLALREAMQRGDEAIALHQSSEERCRALTEELGETRGRLEAAQEAARQAAVLVAALQADLRAAKHDEKENAIALAKLQSELQGAQHQLETIQRQRDQDAGIRQLIEHQSALMDERLDQAIKRLAKSREQPRDKRDPKGGPR